MSEPSAFESLPAIPRRQLFLLTLAFEGGLLAVALAAGWLLDTPFWRGLRLEPRDLIAAVVATGPIVALAILLAERPIGPMGQISRDFDAIIGLFRNTSPLDLAFVSIMAGVGEEALFRGVLQPFAAQWLGAAGGILVASLLFGLAHYISTAYFLFALLLGVYLGCLAFWFDSLALPMVVHALYDFAALLYGVRILAKKRA